MAYTTPFLAAAMPVTSEGVTTVRSLSPGVFTSDHSTTGVAADKGGTRMRTMASEESAAEARSRWRFMWRTVYSVNVNFR
jgi:hypothetical protein